MPTKMFASDPHATAATLQRTGKRYDADKSGLIQVDSAREVKDLVAAGYVVAGGMPVVSKYFLCPKCGWEALIRHCPRCDSDDLKRMTRGDAG